MIVGECLKVTVLGKRTQNDILGVRPAGSHKMAVRVLNSDCSWKRNVVEKLLHSVI